MFDNPEIRVYIPPLMYSGCGGVECERLIQTTPKNRGQHLPPLALDSWQRKSALEEERAQLNPPHVPGTRGPHGAAIGSLRPPLSAEQGA